MLAECIEAPGFRMPNGYAKKWYEGRQQLAHRVAWQQRFGPIPDGLVVMHACDNPACINIDHLILGTQSDNMADKVMKGRQHRPTEKQAHCRRGHEFSEENTRLGTKQGYVTRVCRTCAHDNYLQRRNHGAFG